MICQSQAMADRLSSMPPLNTMFKQSANSTFINNPFTCVTIGAMHETMIRLYEATKALRGVDGQTAVAKLLNMSPQSLNNWESRGMSKAGMLHAQEVVGCSAVWLKTGAPPMSVSGAERESSSAADVRTPTDDEFALVPQLDISAACGEGRFVDHVVVKGGLAFKRSSLRDFGVPEHAARIIYSAGGSMWPTIHDGCVVLLNLADREPRDGKVYAICKPDGDLVLKRLIWDFHPAMGAQTWIMRSDNPDKTEHPDKVLPPDDRTMIAGRAVWNDNRL
ncbi:S24 family peptidase [Cupriavidus basilensis]